MPREAIRLCRRCVQEGRDWPPESQFSNKGKKKLLCKQCTITEMTLLLIKQQKKSKNGPNYAIVRAVIKAELLKEVELQRELAAK